MKGTLGLLAGVGIALLISCRQAQKESAPAEPDPTEQAADAATEQINYTEVGFNQMYREWQFDEARQTLEKALEVNPDNEFAHAHLAWYWVLKRDKEKALEHIQKARSINPEDMYWVQWHGWICDYFNDFDCVEKHMMEAIEMQPVQKEAYFVLSGMYRRQGNEEKALEYAAKGAMDSVGRVARAFHHILKGELKEAMALTDEMEKAPADPFFEPVAVMGLYHSAGETDKALDRLEALYENRSPWLPWVPYAPEFKDLHSEARFQEIVAKIGLPEEAGIAP